MKQKNTLDSHDYERLNALVDGELDEKQQEELLASLDDNPELKGELCDIHRVKELMNFAYPLNSCKERLISNDRVSMFATAASFLFVLAIGFASGFISSKVVSDRAFQEQKSALQAVASSSIKKSDNKVIIYLGHSKKEKFDDTLNKAEELLNGYRNNGTQVYVVTSAGGIDLLRANNSRVQERITKMKGLYASLHFVACNNQIYQLHQKGKSVNLIKEVEVAPSAVQFVVDHLEKGWRYIAI